MAARLPKLAVDPAGNAVAIWKNDGNGKVMAASRGAGGGAWTLYEEPLADSPIIQSNPDPRLALTMTPGGVAVAAWTFAVLFDRDVVQVSTLPLGGEWSDPETVSAMGVDGYDIDLASSPSGAVVIAWQHISVRFRRRVHPGTDPALGRVRMGRHRGRLDAEHRRG